MTVTLDIPANIDQILNLRSREEHLDKMSVLRQLLHEGVETVGDHTRKKLRAPTTSVKDDG